MRVDDSDPIVQASLDCQLPTVVNVTVPDSLVRPGMLNCFSCRLLAVAHLLLVFAGTAWAQGSTPRPPADLSANDSDEEAEEVEDPHAIFREEAATISARTQGWAYVLDDNKMEQLRRRNENLIEPDTPDEKDETGDLNTNQ